MTWVTEITHVVPLKYFVDEQRMGPYAMWHHEHFIEPAEKGVLMRDLVTYKLPLGFLGILAHRLFIRKKLKEIFEYRKKVLDDKYRNRNG
jgi:ligand-binding SRPBCC domain-containing protein